jgi:Nitrous oxide-stimulated promoter
MADRQSRLQRETQTIQFMVQIYCREHHHPAGSLCDECQQLVSYAFQRIDRCPFQADKPTCAKCPIHCYKPVMREKVRQVMRFSGPRMLVYHPVLAMLHYWDELMKKRKLSTRKTD